jgi:hypothetical protein
MRAPGRYLLLSFFSIIALVRCTDPVPDRVVEDQGAEIAGFPEGEFHRPGQNCTACHREDGEAESQFTVAGTIFSSPADLTGVHNAEVQLTDSVGTTHIARTNCVGNFFVRPTEWSPKFPILVRVRKGTTAVSMKSVIGREGSCNACHLAKKRTDEELHRSMPHIALFGGPEPDPSVPEAGCPVDAHVSDLKAEGAQ